MNTTLATHSTSSVMTRFSLALALMLALSTARVAWSAGPEPDPADGPGPSASAPGTGPGAGMAAAASVHTDTGRRVARPGTQGRWGEGTTPGWALMTAAERKEHRERMRAMQDFDECQAFMVQHREQIAIRARNRGITGLRAPRRDPCEAFKP